MDQQAGKIKFGFAKIIKKPSLLNQNGQSSVKVNKIELIDSIEGSSLKILGKDPSDDVEKKLIIPMTNDQKTTPLSKLLEERKESIKSRTVIKSEQTNSSNDVTAEVNKKPINETLEQQAARELIEDLQTKIVKSEVKVFEVPINPDELPLEGAKESSLDDYDRVPIGDFGKAMLRGMGWKDEEKKEDSMKAELDGPILRPKGMGLGADKVIKKQPLLVAPTQSEILEVKRHACVKVLAGKHKNMYGTIEGFDDGGGRVIVKLAIGGLKVTMNEFMVQPIAKQEFAKYGKILNSEKFEEYKTSGSVKPSMVKVEIEDKKPQRERERLDEKERRRSRDRSGSRDRQPAHKSGEKRRDADRYESSSTRKYRGRSRSRSRSRDKRPRKNSSSPDDHKHKKKSSSKHKKHNSSPDSRYSPENEKKHKKKTKKSKKRRDRS